MIISKDNIIKEDFNLDILEKYIIDIKEVAEIYFLYYMHKNFIEKFSIIIAKEFCLNYNE